MSTTSSSRANRLNRDKSGKTPTQSMNIKEKDSSSTKNQMNKPTADQLRIAELIDKKPEDNEYDEKVNQIMELTHKTKEEVVVALHDCNQDTNSTVNLLLEGGGDQGEWQEMGKKKKKAAAQNSQSKPDSVERPERRSNNRERKDRDDQEFREFGEPRERSESSGRGRRMMNNDGPPRFQKAGKMWRGNKENGDSDWNRSRGDRGGNFERGRGRGRGRGGSHGGRGGSFSGGFGSGFKDSQPIDDWGDSAEPKANGFESSPIETWTNDQAANKKTSWAEGEDWNDDDWTGNLTETTVFTARNLSAGSSGNEQQPEEMNPGADDSFIQNAGIPQPIDLGAILNQKPNEKMDLHSQTNSATESLKSMMGIGTSVSHDFSSLNPSMTTGSDSTSSSSLAVGTMSQSMLNQGSMPLQSHRAKPVRSKMPPPSKIPNTPVEMPGMSSMSMRLDVQFGFGAGSGFGDNDSSIGTNYSGSSIGTMNSMTHNGQNNDSSTATVASLASMVQQRQPTNNGIDSTAAQHQSMFRNSPDTTPNKDYQSSLNKALISSPDAYPKQDGQPSPRISSRNPNSLDSDSKYSQNAYPSSYQRFSQKGPESDSAKSSYNKQQSQYQPGFQSNSFQNQANYTKLGQFPTSTSASYRGQGFDPQTDNSPPGYQSQSGYAQKPAQASSYPSGKLSYSQQSSLPGQTSSTYSNTKSFNQADQEFSKAQPSSNSYSTPQTYSSQSVSRPSDESFSSGQSGTFNAGTQSGSAYQSSTGTGFETSSTSSLSTTGQQTQTSNQSTQYGARNSYSTNHTTGLQTSPINATKLSDGLSKMSVEDSTLKSSTTYTDSDVSVTSSNLSQTSSATSSNQLGLTTTAAGATSLTGAKSATNSSTVSKAPPNMPPGVPTVMGPNFIMGQPGMQYYGLQGLTQQPLYSYEDLQLLQQQRLVPGYHAYDPNTALPFQQTPTSISGARDQSSVVSNVQYTAQTSDSKLNRMDAPSPVQGSQSNQQQPGQSHQQFINAALAPGYGYYAYPNAGLMPGGFSYTPTMFQQVPPVTNSAHVQAGTTSSSQYQKAYGASHGYSTYDDLVQAQEYGKSGGYHLQQNAGKVSGAGGIKPITTSQSDLSNAGYGKSHSQSYDKQGFHHGGTPPPYGIPTGVSSGQGNPIAQGGYAPYMPLMSHQHSQMMHPHLQQVRQDQNAMRPGAQPSAAKPATGMSKYGTGYWNTT